MKFFALAALIVTAGFITGCGRTSNNKSLSATELPLTVVNETATTITLSWPAQSGMEGFEFKRDGVRVSNTWNQTLTSVKFGKPSGQHAYGVYALEVSSSGSVTSPPPTPTTTTVPVTTTTASGTTINPGDSWNTAYQAAKPGDTITVNPGSYGDQVIGYRSGLANSTTCTAADTSQCVQFNIQGAVTVSKLEIHGNGILVRGNGSLNSTGYIDTEADSASQHPDHVVVENAHSTSFGVFNADTVTFKGLDVGPATVSTGCATLQGNGFENKIGSAGGVVYSPTNITLDGMTIHDQNGDSGRIDSDCHDGGLFLAGAQGLTIKNSTFTGNVVYNVQIQSINGAPISNVTLDGDSFGCPVNWLYQNNNPLACDGQASVQFDGTYQVTIENSKFAGGDWGCYAGTCDWTQDTFANNQDSPAAVAAP